MKRENWLKWDIYSRQNIKTQWFLKEQKNKAQSYGVFVALVEKLYQSSTGWLPLDNIFTEGFAIEFGMQPLEIICIIEKLSDAGLFIIEKMQTDANACKDMQPHAKFASTRCLEERQILEEKTEEISAKRSAAANARWQQNQKVNMQTDASASMSMQTNANHTDKNRIDKIREEKKEEIRDSVCINSKGVLPDPVPINLPAVPKPKTTHTQDFDFSLLGKWGKAIENGLAKPTGSEPWERTNAFILANRRPLRKFPEIFISPTELADVIRQYEEAGIVERLTDAHSLVSAKVKTAIIEGKSPDKISIAAWYMGWVKQQVLDSKTKQKRLLNAENRI